MNNFQFDRGAVGKSHGLQIQVHDPALINVFPHDPRPSLLAMPPPALAGSAITPYGALRYTGNEIHPDMTILLQFSIFLVNPGDTSLNSF
jgi:hypothetical protein